jgi:hypothetical protein
MPKAKAFQQRVEENAVKLLLPKQEELLGAQKSLDCFSTKKINR